MEYKYVITSEKIREWKKENFGVEFDKILQSFLALKSDIKNGPGKLSRLKDDFYLTKHVGKHSRPTLVWLRLVKDDICFYVFRAAYRHDEYMTEINVGKLPNYIGTKLLSENEEAEIKSKYEEIVSKRNAKPQVCLSPLTTNELAFISSLLPINYDLFKDPIYETRQWVDDITSEDDDSDSFDEFSLAAQMIENYIFDNIDSENGWGEISIKERLILIYHKEDSWILAGAPFSTDIEKINSIKKQGYPADFLRGYPFTFLGTKDEWRRMEKESKSNLVLTEEQVQVVASNEPNYPLFISGRAGSGKSTVLQYLFAEVLLRYLSIHKSTQDNSSLLSPVYLSYSKTLINEAKALSTILFDKNTVYKDALKKEKIDYKSDIQPILENVFYVFKDLLKSCINKHNSDLLSYRFSEQQYISFAVFKRKWMERFSKDRDVLKNCGPSICWHIIRTYIKGWNSEAVTTPEDYKKLGRNYVTVTQDTFKYVYDNVWEKWYKELTEEDYWDDQDLVKFCLENGYADERFSAVYCDEAQDFTRIEIDFILKISSFSNRKIDNVDAVRKLPFVFAGDEFQTLNPTGFSWDSLRSYFVDRIFKMTGLGENADKSNLPRPIEFNENFRSTSQIVQLANRIQLLRASRLGEYSKPQKPHFAIDGPSIYCISPNENQSIWDAMGDTSKLVNMIVPVAEGESVEEYIKNSPLKDKINFQAGVPQGLTILTPAQAKGCEYANVILYGFSLDGVNSAFGIDNLLAWFSDNSQKYKSEEDIELKYQICNAYVAATRATTRLYILDDFNRDSFWAFAFNDSDNKNRSDIMTLQAKMLYSLNNKKAEWSEDNLLGWINEPPTEDFSYFEDMTAKDIREELDRTKKNAEMREDSDFMRMVACRYKERGKNEEYYDCIAKAFVYEGKNIDAAENFVMAKKYSSAFEYYWKELGGESSVDKILQFIVKLKGKVDDVRLVQCCIAKGELNVVNLKNLLADANSYLSKKDNKDGSSWQALIDYVLPKIQSKPSEVPNIVVCVKLLDSLTSYGIEVNTDKFAMLAYHCGAETEAMKLWEQQQSEYPKEYYLIKYKTLPYPNNLEFAPKIGISDWFKDVLSQYRSNKNKELTELQKQILCMAIRKDESANEDFKYFFSFMLQNVSDKDKLQTLLKEAKARGLNEINEETITYLLFIKKGEIDKLNPTKRNFVNADTKLFFKAMEDVCKMQTKDYRSLINRKLEKEQVRISDIIMPFKQYANTPLAPLVFLELGKLLERRERKLDTIRYYEQVKLLSDQKDFRTVVTCRWILSKEILAEKTGNSQYEEEAKQKRLALGIEDVTIPEVPSLTVANWENLFLFAVSLDMRVLSDDVEALDLSQENEHKITLPPAQNPGTEFSTKKQVFRYDDYVLTYFPKKKELKISYESEEDDYSIKITNGEFPENGDFSLKGNRVYLDDQKAITPFVITRTEAALVVEIYDDDKPTGISVVTLI